MVPRYKFLFSPACATCTRGEEVRRCGHRSCLRGGGEGGVVSVPAVFGSSGSWGHHCCGGGMWWVGGAEFVSPVCRCLVFLPAGATGLWLGGHRHVSAAATRLHCSQGREQVLRGNSCFYPACPHRIIVQGPHPNSSTTMLW